MRSFLGSAPYTHQHVCGCVVKERLCVTAEKKIQMAVILKCMYIMLIWSKRARK